MSKPILCLMLFLTSMASGFPLEANSLPVLPAAVQSPADLADFMRHYFSFEEDRRLFGVEDYWQTPEEFWDRRTGDCEDYAVFARYALQMMGIESYVVSLYGTGGYAHTVALYKFEGHYGVINMDENENSAAENVEEALRQVYPDWTIGAYAELSESRGWAKGLIYKSPSEGPSKESWES